jgi:hypothetical protein
MSMAIGNVSGARPLTLPGCADTACATHEGFAAAVAAAKTVDAVVIAVGLVGRPKIFADDGDGASDAGFVASGGMANNDGSEGEGHDRTAITLPDGQTALVEAILGAVKPTAVVTLVLFNGGGLAIEAHMADPRTAD